MFNEARLKLTLWYLLILMLISFGFSVVIYKVLDSELNRFSFAQRMRLENRFREFRNPNFEYSPRLFMTPDLVDETRKRIVLFLFLINGGILVAGGTLSYFLAGKTLKPIEEMVSQQKQFISDASHEFKTPLASLKTSLEVALRDKNLDLAESKRVLKDNLVEVERLQKLTENLLVLSRYEAEGKGKRNLSRVNFSLIFDEALRRVKPLLKAKGIRLKKDIKEVEFLADAESMVELLVVLLDNAIKYSYKKGIVEVVSYAKRNFLFFEVKDYGIGIKPEDQKHIFDRFYRADSSRQSNERQGFGIGLSLAKRIVEKHKGEIFVKSKFGKGSVFVVKIPLSS